MDTLGKRILRLINEQNLTQKELARRVGTTEVSIGRYINGKREPNATVLGDIARVLDVTTDYLLGLSTSPDIEDEDPQIKILARSAKSLTPEQLKTVQAVIDSYERDRKSHGID